eukprot:6908801-Prymnesium_polylepis.2
MQAEFPGVVTAAVLLRREGVANLDKLAERGESKPTLLEAEEPQGPFAGDNLPLAGPFLEETGHRHEHAVVRVVRHATQHTEECRDVLSQEREEPLVVGVDTGYHGSGVVIHRLILHQILPLQQDMPLALRGRAPA